MLAYSFSFSILLFMFRVFLNCTEFLLLFIYYPQGLPNPLEDEVMDPNASS